MEKKIYRVKGIIFKRKLIRPKRKKEGKPTIRRIVMPFNVEVVSTSEKNAVDKIVHLFSSIHKVRRSQVKIDEVKEITLEDVRDIQLKKFIESVQNGEF